MVSLQAAHLYVSINLHSFSLYFTTLEYKPKIMINNNNIELVYFVGIIAMKLMLVGE